MSYPVLFPSRPAPREFKLTKISTVAAVSAPYSPRIAQLQDWQGEFWAGHVEYPVIKNPATLRDFSAAFAELNGQLGTFLMGHPGRREPLEPSGVTGLPVITGANQRGRSLLTQGYGIAGRVLSAGDHIQVARNYIAHPTAIDNAAWGKNQCSSSSANTQASWDGTVTAERVTPNGGATDAYIAYVAEPDGVGGRVFYASVWLRAVSGTPAIALILTNQAYTQRGVMVAPLTTTWQRYQFSATMDADDTQVRLVVGGNGTWPVADGAIDITGCSLWSDELGARLYELRKPLIAAGANSAATVDLWPSIRECDDYAPLILSNARGTFRLASNQVDETFDIHRMTAFSFDFVEAP